VNLTGFPHSPQEDYVKRHVTCAVMLVVALFVDTARAMDEGPLLSDVNAVAGLAPVLDLSCTDVKLGVWRVQPGVRGGSSTITLSLVGSTTKYAISGAKDGVGLASGVSSVPQAGVCTMVNSNNPGAMDAKLVLSGNEGLEFQTASVLNRKRAVKGLSGATGLKARLWIPDNGLKTINAAGGAAWRVLGELTIPESVAIDNYGGYMTTTPATATYRYPVQ